MIRTVVKAQVTAKIMGKAAGAKRMDKRLKVMIVMTAIYILFVFIVNFM